MKHAIDVIAQTALDLWPRICEAARFSVYMAASLCVLALYMGAIAGVILSFIAGVCESAFYFLAAPAFIALAMVAIVTAFRLLESAIHGGLR